MSEAHSLDAVAEKLGVDERTVRAWISNGEIKAVNLSRSRTSQKPRLRIMEDEIERFLESRSTETPVRKPRRRELAPVKRYF